MARGGIVADGKSGGGTNTGNKKAAGTTGSDTTGAGKNADNTQVQVSIVYLPDLQNPVYAKLRSGYGSANLSLAFQSGMLTSVGQTTDTKIPETITALAGMATAAGGFLKLAPPAPKTEKPDFTLYEIDNSSGTTILKKVEFQP